jgi:hypothetical protein
MNQTGRNDKCPCSSKKKYKLCCLKKKENEKIEQNNKYLDGHQESSEDVKIVTEYLRDEYPDHKVIDISNYLTEENYRDFQVKNYYDKTLMVAIKNDTNKKVFETRGSPLNDLIIMYKGSYRTLELDNMDKFTGSIDQMIKTRLEGKNDE